MVVVVVVRWVVVAVVVVVCCMTLDLISLTTATRRILLSAPAVRVRIMMLSMALMEVTLFSVA